MNHTSFTFTVTSDPDPYNQLPELEKKIRQVILAGLGVDTLADVKRRLPENPRIFIKPNWVYDKPSRNKDNFDSMVTHKSIVLSMVSILDELQPKEIIIGDSPVQECVFENIVDDEYREAIKKITSAEVKIVNLSRYLLSTDREIKYGKAENQDGSSYLLFDLKDKSYLEPISSRINRFQIPNCDNELLRAHHRKGRHEYLIYKAIFDVDLIINLPKLKTHRKAGYTAAIKNFVGCVGDKVYLPHHRMGGTVLGGDSYPGLHPLRLFRELCLNQRDHHIPNIQKFDKWNYYAQFFSRVDRWITRVFYQNRYIFEGAWSGNDTVWRTALDIFKIIECGDKQGQIQEKPQREIWSLVDAIVCGEGNGPLNPDPYHLGMLFFSTSGLALDYVLGKLIGYTPAEVKFLAALQSMVDQDEITINCEDRRFSVEDFLQQHQVPLKKPDYW